MGTTWNSSIRIAAGAIRSSVKRSRSPNLRALFSNATPGLLEISREPGKGGEIDRVVLHDEPRLPVLDDPLDPVDRGQRFGARGVEIRYAAELAVVPQVVEIAGQDHRARLPQLKQQDLMSRRVPGRLEDAHGSVAKDVVIAFDHLVLRLAVRAEAGGVH